MTNNSNQNPTANPPPNQSAGQDSDDSLAALENLIKQSQQRANQAQSTPDAASPMKVEKGESGLSEAEEMAEIVTLKEKKDQETQDRLKKHEQEMQVLVKDSPQTVEREKSKHEQEKQARDDVVDPHSEIRQLSHTKIKVKKENS